MKVAVIGGKGYIGKHLVYYLQQMGITAQVYDVQDDKEQNYKKIDITNSDSETESELVISIFL